MELFLHVVLEIEYVPSLSERVEFDERLSHLEALGDELLNRFNVGACPALFQEDFGSAQVSTFGDVNFLPFLYLFLLAGEFFILPFGPICPKGSLVSSR